MPDFELAGLDLAVIGLYAVGIVAIGFGWGAVPRTLTTTS